MGLNTQATVRVWSEGEQKYITIWCTEHKERGFTMWTSHDGITLSPGVFCPHGCPLGDWQSTKDMNTELEKYKNRLSD